MGITNTETKRKMKKHGKTVACISILVCAIITGCAAIKDFEPVSAKVTGIDQFGDVILDIREIGLEYGDSVDLSFSGGYEIESVPYYPDFYGNKDES